MTEIIHTVEPIPLQQYDPSAPDVTVLRLVKTEQLSAQHSRDVPCYAVEPCATSKASLDAQYSLVRATNNTDLEPGQHQWKPLFDIRTDAFYNRFPKAVAAHLEIVEERDRLTKKRLNVDSLSHLSGLLVAHEISVAHWKQGERSDIKSLMEHIDEGDITLHELDDGRIMAATSPAMINVYYIDYDDPFHPILELREARRTLYNERGKITEVSEGPKTRSSMGATRHIGLDPIETPYEAALRGLEEELGVTSFNLLRATGIILQPPRSHHTYKGLLTEYRPDYFVAELDKAAFKPVYEETKRDINGVPMWQSIFAWRQVADERNTWSTQAS